MKMIRAIVRPEREEKVLAHLEAVGVYAVTKIPVLGRGRQRGVQVGTVTYDLLSKSMLMLVVPDADYDKAVHAIEMGASTGNPGDGKIFVQDLSEVYAVRTGLLREETP